MKDSDALIVAKFLWPSVTAWTERGEVCAQVDGLGFAIFDSGEHGHVATAERVLIERGHAERYGMRLAVELFNDWAEDEQEREASSRGLWELYRGEQFAKLATAPLPARVKALAAVIRSLTP